MSNLFLLQENNGFLLQENGRKIIIGFTLDAQGGGSGGQSTAFGHSLVKKQLGDKFIEKIHHRVTGKILLQRRNMDTQVTLKINKPIVQPKTLYTLESIAISKLLLIESLYIQSKLFLTESLYIKSKLLSKESFSIESKIILKESFHVKSNMLKNQMYELVKSVYSLTDIMHKNSISQENLEKQKNRNNLLRLKRILTEDRRVPFIQVSLNQDIHQRGDLMRITANMSVAGQIWMRIIDSNGMIVQKAGLVKNNATGFQILVGTRDLKAGKYTIQVSSKNNFSPLGVVEFQVKGNSPILPFIPVIPFLLTPDSPTLKFQRVQFKTMQDSKVDSACQKFENKIFHIDDKNLPVPPIHFNCRCWLDGVQ